MTANQHTLTAPAGPPTHGAKHTANVLHLTDFCKGMAIVWVFFIHYYGGWFGWQAVHVFIVLSGFGLAYSCLKKNRQPYEKVWYLARVRRVLPGYWFAVLLSLPLLIVLRLITGHDLYPSFIRTFLNLLLLTNFFEKYMGGAAGAFWYIPFIIGCYLIFPFLYTQLRKHCTVWGHLAILLVVAVVEFLYRAISIYWLDGLPISYDHAEFFGLLPESVSPLNYLSDSVMYGFFQRRSPFGFFPSRIAEFTLGMMAAFAIFHHGQRVNRLLLNVYTGLTGMLIWFGGQVLVIVGLWGWIFADFVLALGLLLWMPNVAYLFQKLSRPIFRSFTWLGIWSFYIYLTHQPFLRLCQRLESVFLPVDTGVFIGLTLFGLAIVATCLASRLVWTFDCSKCPTLLTQGLAKILR
jgi:peptidoglycan/LPS O-acetylase OafA/YrhL